MDDHLADHDLADLHNENHDQDEQRERQHEAEALDAAALIAVEAAQAAPVPSRRFKRARNQSTAQEPIQSAIQGQQLWRTARPTGGLLV